jgi:ABC-type multidrug transport system fused ATPase/permease subunit
MKGLLAANKKNFIKFLGIRSLLQIDDFILPFIIAMLIDWIQAAKEEPLYDTLCMFALALTVPAVQCIVHTIWEYFCFQMIDVGHRAHTSLKVMLFRKNLKMTGATNKDFASGEVNNIIMNESNRIWDFIWQGPAYLECFLHLTVSSAIVFQ